jgi:hypothetical protein
MEKILKFYQPIFNPFFGICRQNKKGENMFSLLEFLFGSQEVTSARGFSSTSPETTSNPSKSNKFSPRKSYSFRESKSREKKKSKGIKCP